MSWWKSQLDFAEGLLERVDKSVTALTDGEQRQERVEPSNAQQPPRFVSEDSRYPGSDGYKPAAPSSAVYEATSPRKPPPQPRYPRAQRSAATPSSTPERRSRQKAAPLKLLPRDEGSDHGATASATTSPSIAHYQRASPAAPPSTQHAPRSEAADARPAAAGPASARTGPASPLQHIVQSPAQPATARSTPTAASRGQDVQTGFDAGEASSDDEEDPWGPVSPKRAAAPRPAPEPSAPPEIKEARVPEESAASQNLDANMALSTSRPVGGRSVRNAHAHAHAAARPPATEHPALSRDFSSDDKPVTRDPTSPQSTAAGRGDGLLQHLSSGESGADKPATLYAQQSGAQGEPDAQPFAASSAGLETRADASGRSAAGPAPQDHAQPQGATVPPHQTRARAEGGVGRPVYSDDAHAPSTVHSARRVGAARAPHQTTSVEQPVDADRSAHGDAVRDDAAAGPGHEGTAADGTASKFDSAEDERAQQELLARLENAERQRRVLEEELASARKAAAASDAKARGVELERASTESALEHERAAAAAAQQRAAARVQEAEREASALRTRLGAALERADIASDQLQTCERRLNELEQERDGLADAQTALQEQLETVRADNQKAVLENAQSDRGYLERLQSELAAATAAADEATQALSEERRQAAEARRAALERQEALEASVAAAQQDSADARASAEEAAEALANTEARLERAQAQLASLQQAQHAAQESGTAQEAASSGGIGKDELQQLHTALEVSEARCKSAQQAASAAQGELEHLRKEAASTSSRDLQEAQSQLAQAQQILIERQSFWERDASQRAARILALERELQEVKAVAAGQDRRRRSDASAAPQQYQLLPDTLVPMEALGYYHRFANHHRLGGAVKAIGGTLDSVTAQAVATLRQYPVVRLGIVAYLIFIHCFVYVLIGHMQRLSVQDEAQTALPGKMKP